MVLSGAGLKVGESVGGREVEARVGVLVGGSLSQRESGAGVREREGVRDKETERWRRRILNPSGRLRCIIMIIASDRRRGRASGGF